MSNLKFRKIAFFRQHFTFLLTLGLSLISLLSCRKTPEKDLSEANQLYARSRALLIHYINIMRTMPDSTALDSIDKVFEKEYEKMNMSFSPGTDLLLTEIQNDTLALLTEIYVKARNKRIGPPIAVNDSGALTPPPVSFIKSKYPVRKIPRSDNTDQSTTESSPSSSENISTSPSTSPDPIKID